MAFFRIPGFGATLRRNALPEYDRNASLETNWRRFFEWGLELRQPHVTIPEVPGAEVITHPIGFTAVYLTQRARGVETPEVRGVIRANVISPGVKLRDDVHSHGYWFTSGLVAGEVTNNRYAIDFSQRAPDGQGYIGYQTTPDFYGQNHVRRVTGATVIVPDPEAHELTIGEDYSMNPRDEFHSLETDGGITIFGKQPAGAGNLVRGEAGLDLSLILRRADQPPPPPEY